MLHFKRSGYGLTKRQTLSAPCHIKYALTVWIHACPNIPQITKHDLWVRSFFRVIVSSVYPCGAVERLHVHTTHPRETNTGFFFFLLMQTTLCALQIRPEVDCCQSVSRSVSVLLRGLWRGGGKKSWRGSVSSTETIKFKRATCGLRIWREHCEEKNKPDDVLRAGENIDFSYLSMLHFVSYHSPVPVFSLSLCPNVARPPLTHFRRGIFISPEWSDHKETNTCVDAPKMHCKHFWDMITKATIRGQMWPQSFSSVNRHVFTRL